MEDLLAKAVDYGLRLGADYVEARWQLDVGEVAGLRNGEFEFSSSYRHGGVSIRVLAGGGLGFSATPRVEVGDVLEAVERAYRLARAAFRKRPVAFSEEKLANVRYFLPEISVGPLEVLKELDGHIDRGLSVRRLVGTVWVTEKLVVTSDGGYVYSKIPRIYVFAMFIKHSHVGSLQRGLSAGGVSLKALRGVEKVVEEESRKVSFLLERARTITPDRYDVVFSPEMAGILVHESVGHPFELDRIFGREGAEAGESYIRPENLYVKIGSSHVDIVDNPALPEAYGFYLVDDEGVVARPKWLVKGGQASEFISNRQYAALINSRSNAGARASAFDREPIPRMSNTYLLPGDWSPEEIIRDTKRGIYVASYTEWNIDDVRYSGRYGIFEGYLVENGELKHPVKGFIEVDTPELWGGVDAVGKDFSLFVGTCGKGNPMQGIPVTMGGPTFRSRSLRVT